MTTPSRRACRPREPCTFPEIQRLPKLAFDRNPDAVFAYSHAAQVTQSGERDESRFDESHGLRYEEVHVDGRDLIYAASFASTPHNVSYIWYAPTTCGRSGGTPTSR